MRVQTDRTATRSGRRLVVLGTVVAMLLTGCGGSEPPTQLAEPSSDRTDTGDENEDGGQGEVVAYDTPTEGPCSLVSPDDIEELFGPRVTDPLLSKGDNPRSVQPYGIGGECYWTASAGGDDFISVEVKQYPTDEAPFGHPRDIPEGERVEGPWDEAVWRADKVLNIAAGDQLFQVSVKTSGGVDVERAVIVDLASRLITGFGSFDAGEDDGHGPDPGSDEAEAAEGNKADDPFHELPDPARPFYGLDGQDPAEDVELGFFGAAAGTTLHDVEGWLGEAHIEESQGTGLTSYSWVVGRTVIEILTVRSGEVDVIELTSNDTAHRIAVPGGLVMHRDSFGIAVAQLGEPTESHTDLHDNVRIVQFSWPAPADPNYTLELRYVGPDRPDLELDRAADEGRLVQAAEPILFNQASVSWNG